MRRTPWSWVELRLFGAPLLFLAALIVWRTGLLRGFRLDHARQADFQSGCQKNLRTIATALRQYSADYDGRFPPSVIGGSQVPGWRITDSRTSVAGRPPVGWADSIQPYVRTESVFLCYGGDPSPSSSPHGPPFLNYTYYWFNDNAAGKPVATISNAATAFLVGDGSDGTEINNATYALKAFPGKWKNDYDSPLYRHLGGANFAFVDGHVSKLYPEQAMKYNEEKNGFNVVHTQ